MAYFTQPPNTGQEPQDTSEAFAGWVREHYAVLFRIAYGKTRSRELAEDLVQEAYTKAWRAGRFDVGRPRAWLVEILSNTMKNHYRGRRVEWVPLDVAFPEGDATDPDDAIVVRQAVQRLPGRQREVVQLFYGLQLSVEEIGTIVGSPVNTVKTRLHAARKRLRTELEP